jgi:hypothetical protein
MSTLRDEPSHRYQTLDTTRQQIRLLKLHPSLIEATLGFPKAPYVAQCVHCELTIFDLATTPAYIALSYVWGPPNPTQAICVDKKKFSVRQNLYEFLQTFHRDPANDCYLWIDQICIDQNSIAERNSQVQLMASIYKRSKFTVSWLGLSSSACAEDFLADISYSKARAVLLNPYFTRLWIAQEIMLPRHLHILCGHIWIQEELIARVVSSPAIIQDRQILRALRLLSGRNGHPLLLAAAVDQYAEMECYDPRDKVYGLLGLVDVGQRPEVDYSKALHEVYFDVIDIICKRPGDAPLKQHSQFASFHPKRRAQYLRFARDIGLHGFQLRQLETFF